MRIATTGLALLNLAALNADGGITREATSASQTIQHEGFGGLFNSAAAVGATHLTLTGTHTGPRFTQSFTVETEGGNVNGPGSSAYALWLNSKKTDYLTSTETGEVDGLYILVNQGIESDVGGILIAVYKVDGGTGGITAIESVANRIDGSGNVVLSNDTVVNFLEGPGGLSQASSGAGGHGVYSEARHGTIWSAFTAAAGTDFGANLTNFFVGSLSRDPADIRFSVSTAGAMTLISDTAQNMLTLQCTDSGAAAFSMLFERPSASPANGDIIAQINFRGRNDAAATVAYGLITVTAQNVTAASSIGRLGFWTTLSGTITERMRIASGVYHPSATGGDKGANTINFGAVYDDNVLLTDYVFDLWAGHDVKGSDRILAKAAAFDTTMFDPAAYAAFFRQEGRLWGMPDLNDQIDGIVKEHSLGGMVQLLWQTAEINAIHVDNLAQRVTALEARIQ